MTRRVKTGFILSIFAHILSWGPIIYFIVAYMDVVRVIEGDYSGSHIGSLNYSLLSSIGTVAVVLGVISMINLGRRTDEPKDLPYRTAGRILDISAFVLVGLSAAFIVICFFYFLTYIFGF